MKLVTTWFHTEDSGTGIYAQVRGASNDERFRDTYRRCLATFFLAARRANPDATLILYTNVPFDRTASPVANQVATILERLSVEQVILPYHHEPPRSFTANWRNQFYVLDVLQDLLSRTMPDDFFTVLDSDVVWTTTGAAARFWTYIEDQLGALPLGYDHDTAENGLSARGLAERLGATSPTEYFGGEIVAGPAKCLPTLVGSANDAYESLMAQHSADESVAFEEAHVLSAAYQKGGYVRLDPRVHIKRMWTQALRYRNVSEGDQEVALWHVPAEKEFGLRRLFGDLTRRGDDAMLALPEARWHHLIQSRLGVPKNDARKWLADVAYAAVRRTRPQARRERAPAEGVDNATENGSGVSR